MTIPPEYAPNTVEKQRPNRRRRAGLMAAGLLAVTATAGFGGSTLAQSLSTEEPAAAATPAARWAAFDRETELGDVTLDSLAEELARLGLELEVRPSSDSDPSTTDSAESDSISDDGPNGDDNPNDDDWPVGDDPFAGMTDAEIDALSDDEFYQRLEDAGYEIDEDGYISEDGEFDDSDQDGGDHDDHHDGEPNLLGAFAIDGDRIDTDGASPEVAEQARAIWERFTKLIPADQRQMVTSFELDGEDGGGAYVYPSDQDPTKWVLGVSTGLGQDLDYVLVHEFGHLLTLQAKEVPPSGDADSCTTYYTGEGCALSGSTFAQFVQRFWPQELLDELAAIDDYEAQDAFYNKHRDSFVTDYATSNPGEDLAETFAVFVTGDRPTGSTVADQKVEFLWSDPTMVALRSEIRANL